MALVFHSGFETGSLKDWNPPKKMSFEEFQNTYGIGKNKRAIGAIKCPDCEYEIEHSEPLYSPDNIHVYCPKCKADLNNRPLTVVF